MSDSCISAAALTAALPPTVIKIGEKEEKEAEGEKLFFFYLTILLDCFLGCCPTLEGSCHESIISDAFPWDFFLSFFVFFLFHSPPSVSKLLFWVILSPSGCLLDSSLPAHVESHLAVSCVSLILYKYKPLMHCCSASVALMRRLKGLIFISF